MSDIRQWLEKRGLAKYIDTFEENEIDFELLPSLTDHWLVEMGIAAVGARIKILEGI